MYYSKQELLEEIVGRGPGDPDLHGHYPGDPDEKNCLLCKPKHVTPSVYRERHITYCKHEAREFGDNHPASLEEAGW